MADQRAPLTEEILRETKDDLIRRVADQKRMGGIPNEPLLERDPTGGVRDAEIWLEPILRKVEKDHVRERDRDILRPSEPIQERRHADTKEEVGTYDWNLRTNQIIATPGSWEAKNHAQEKVRAFVASLFRVPEWKDSLTKVARLCGKHYAPNPTCGNCHKREDGLRRLIAVAMTKFKKPAAKVSVG
jgi:hypothetical protein